jgi:hypothetical protein
MLVASCAEYYYLYDHVFSFEGISTGREKDREVDDYPPHVVAIFQLKYQI